MVLPSLASRPFLNTRPVWIVVASAAFLTVVLVVANATLYFSSSEHLGAELALQRRAVAKDNQLTGALQRDGAALQQVRWSALGKRVDALNQILGAHGFSWLDMLSDLGGVLPYGVRLVRISPRVTTDGVELMLSGVAQTRQSMLEFLQNLIDDPHFDRPLPSRESTPEGSKGTGYEFRLTVQYLPEGGSK